MSQKRKVPAKGWLCENKINEGVSGEKMWKISVETKGKIPYFVALTLFWIVLLTVKNPLEYSYYENFGVYEERLGGNGVGATANLETGVEVLQTFEATRNGLKGIKLYAAAYQRTNDCVVNIVIQDDAGTVLYNEQIDTSSWKDDWYSFEFESQDESKNAIYTIKLCGVDGTNENSPAMWFTNDLDENESYMEVNGQTQPDCALLLQSIYNIDYSLWRNLIIFCWGIIILASYLFVLFMGQADEKSFLALSVLLGWLFIVINPFVHVLDEATHFFRAFGISQFDLLNETVDGQIGSYMPSNFMEILQYKLSIKSFALNPQFWLQKFDETEVFYVNPYASSIIPMNHFVGAVGVILSKIFRMNVLGTVLTGRMTVYIYYTVVSYWAIKNTKYYKSLFFMLTTLPIVQWLAGSYSTDPVLIANTLLFVSICFKYRFSDTTHKILKKEIVLLMFLGASVASVKYCIYAPVLLVFFLIPKECFKNKKEYKTTVALAVGVIFLVILCQLGLLQKFPFKEDRIADVDTIGQVKFMLNNVGFSIKNFMEYFVSNVCMHLQRLHYDSTLDPISNVLSMWCVFAAMIAPDKYSFKTRKDKRIFLIIDIVVVALVCMMVMAALYVGYTPVGSSGIKGLQTRYFLPILIFVMHGLSLCEFRNESATYTKTVVFVVEIALLLCLTGTMSMMFNSL